MFARAYGDRPLHLLAAVASFAVATYAFVEIAGNPSALGFAVWFVAAIIAHDLIAFPLYSLLGLIAGRAAGPPPAGAWLNYVRVPAVLSGLAFLVWFPFILGLSDTAYEAASGRSTDPYLGRWLLLTAALFLLSGIAYAIGARRRAGPSGSSRADD